MKYIHVVSFDVPFPPDYGGAFAVYNLLVKLKEHNIGVYLHVFQYNTREVGPELKSLCDEIYTYKRQTGIWSNLSFLPYIVRSRRHPDLAANLLKDEFPVLFEGVHCTYYLSDISRKKKNVFVRAHNVEWKYYSKLAENEKSWLRRIFFRTEALRLKYFESHKLRQAKKLFCFTQKDAEWFAAQGNSVQVVNPVFSGMKVSCLSGKGTYSLIHGNLSINEMNRAVCRILESFKNHPNHRIIIAGKNPDRQLTEFVESFENAEMIVNPDTDTMNRLIEQAHIHLCYTEVGEGFKMRLISLLERGRFIICNEKFCSEPSLLPLLKIENDTAKWPKLCTELMQAEFRQQEIDARIKILNDLSTKNGIEPMLKTIFGT